MIVSPKNTTVLALPWGPRERELRKKMIIMNRAEINWPEQLGLLPCDCWWGESWRWEMFEPLSLFEWETYNQNDKIKLFDLRVTPAFWNTWPGRFGEYGDPPILKAVPGAADRKSQWQGEVVIRFWGCCFAERPLPKICLSLPPISLHGSFGAVLFDGIPVASIQLDRACINIGAGQHLGRPVRILVQQ